MAECLDSIAAVEDVGSGDGEYFEDNEGVSLDSFINDSVVDNNPSDYYGLINVTRLTSSAEEDVL